MLVSVCIPTYNQGKYIEQCVRSLITQVQRPDEIIISNDQSTDDTAAIIDRLAEEIPLLRVIHQSVNLGMVANTNFCLRLAKNEIIVKLDSDDYLLPSYIETLCKLLVQYPDAGYAHGAVQEVNEINDERKVRRLFRKDGFQSNEVALKALCSGYKVAANIIMFRKSALEAAGYITSKVNFAEDYYLSVKIADAGFGNVYSSKILSAYRVWNDTGSLRQKRKLNEINGIRLIFEGPIKSAFVKRGWPLNVLAKKKKDFACTQCNCLMWKIYNATEKRELELAIYDLSSASKVRLYAFLYKNGMGGLLTSMSSLSGKPKQLIKKWFR